MTGHDGSSGVTRLMVDVQRFGLLSAASIVERYIDAVDEALGGLPGGSGPPDRLEAGWLVDSAARLAQAGTRALDTLTSLVVEGVGRLDRGGGDVLGRAPDRLELPATHAGSTCAVSLWVHNPTTAPVVGVDLRVTPLASPGGSTIAVEAVSLSLARVDVVAAHGREEVRLRVEVPPGQPAGEYHGLVLTPVAPSEPLALRLVVLARGEPAP